MSVSKEFFLSQDTSVRCFLYCWNGAQILKNKPLYQSSEIT